MKISPINYRYNNNINFTSKVTRVIHGSVPEDLREQVDIFEETNGKNAKKLGHGLFAEAYLINGTNCVIKKSKTGKAERINGDFSDEARALLNIPEGFSHAQNLIGNVETEDGNYYLLSTFMEGKIPNGETTKWDKESLGSILDSLAKLDCARVYHGDVSRCNCLITDKKDVNLLDFQYCDKFSIETDDDHKKNASVYKVPYFIAPSNAQMFEESNFATYLSSIDESEARELFKTYLMEKSEYHKKRAEAFKAQGARPEIVEYDRLMAKYLKNPSDDMIYLQAKKLQVLSTHRYILSATDTRKQDDFYNIMSAPVYYLHAIEDSNEAAEYADNLIEQTNDEDLKKLLDYEKRDALFWRSMMKNELEGRHGNESVFNWVLRNAKRTPRDEADNILSTFINTAELKHKPVPDIAQIVSGSDLFFGFDNEKYDDVSSSIQNAISNLRKTQCFVSPIKSLTYKDIRSYHKTKQEIMGNLKLARELYTEDNKYESLFYSLCALYQTTIAKNKADKILGANKLSPCEKQSMIKESEFLSGYTEELASINGRMYERLFKKASKEN